MNLRLSLLSPALAACVLIGAGVVMPSAADAQSISVQYGRPPPPRVEVLPPPRAGYVWAPGHWEWRRGRYVWIGGAWLLARPGYAYRPPSWVDNGGRWNYRGGAWDRDGDGVPNRYDSRPNNPYRR